jgi:hypothetical protein
VSRIRCVIVCGGRKYADRDRVFVALDRFDEKHKIMLLVHGGATGADTLADEWAQARGVPQLPFPVTKDEWDTYGRAAGPMRNDRMLKLSCAQACIAFPGGNGTEDMVQRCEAAGVPVWRPYG